MELHRVVRRRSSHICYTVDSQMAVKSALGAFHHLRLRWDSKVWLRVLRDLHNWVITLQSADSSSRQRGRPTQTGPLISDSNIPTGNTIWSQVPQGYSITRHAGWMTTRHVGWMTVSLKVTSPHLTRRRFVLLISVWVVHSAIVRLEGILPIFGTQNCIRCFEGRLCLDHQVNCKCRPTCFMHPEFLKHNFYCDYYYYYWTAIEVLPCGISTRIRHNTQLQKQ
jgi:hypothetical protein